MRILLLTLSAGQGHNATATALRAAFEAGGHHCTLLDTLKYYNIVLGTSIDKGYELSVTYSKSLYASFYDRFDKRSKPKDSMPILPYFFYSIMGPKFEKFINEFKPQAILCSHPAPAMLMDVLKKQLAISCPVFGVLTDYTVAPFWNFCLKLDYFITPTELLNRQAKRKGISAKLLPLGIPVAERFDQQGDQLTARSMLGLEPELFTVLVMSGGFGFGNVQGQIKAIDRLDEAFQIVCVSGRNSRLKAKIDRLVTRHPLHSYGFVDNVDVMMDAANCLISKPGGLTSSEALAKRLPMIMVNPIPGQEDRNMDFLLNTGVAMLASQHYPIEDCLHNLIALPALRRNMQENMALIAKKQACQRIVEAVETIVDSSDQRAT